MKKNLSKVLNRSSFARSFIQCQVAAALFVVMIVFFAGAMPVSAESAYVNAVRSGHEPRAVISYAVQQGRVVSGQVISGDDNQGMPGVNLVIKGTTVGTVTDMAGNYTIQVPSSESVLVFSFVGYAPQEISVGNQSVLNVTLESDVRNLQEVVVVGYGEQKRATVTGAISTVKSEDLLRTPVANVSNALIGRMTGVLAKQGSSEPGFDQSTIRIRGIGTFSGSQDPLIMVDGVKVDNFNNIDPNEIESISVLKDASATAVYGVRGANGVLLITTKRGQKGKPVLSFSSNYAFSRIIDMREYSDSYTWAKGFNEALQYDAYATQSVYIPRWSEKDVELFRNGEDPIFHPNTDWVDLMMKTWAPQSYNNLNINGGTDRVRYFASLGVFSQGGLFNEDIMDPDYSSQIHFKRYNFRSNLDFDVTKQLTIKVNLSTQIEERRGPAVGATPGNGTGQIFANMQRVPPAMSPGWIDGKVVNVYDFFGGNPLLRLLGGGVNEQYDNSLNGMIRLDHKLDFIARGLSAHGTVSYRNYNTQLRNHGKGVVQYRAKKLPDGSVNLVPQGLESPYNFGESIYSNNTTYAELGLDYSRSFGDHNVTSLLYYNQEKTIDPNLEFLVPHGYQGLVGRITYDYKRRYLAELNIGYNGTENFAQDRRFGVFPAYSLGWVVSEESFFNDNDWVSFVKIRGSYGEVGNDQIGGARFLYRPSSYSYGQFGNYYHFGEYGVSYNRITGSSEGLIGNPALTWERARKMNVGAELNLWKDRISVTADVFRETRNDILAKKNTLPTIFGANRPAFDFPVQNGYWLPAFNIGEMTNSGFDGEIAYNHSLGGGKFDFWIKANYTYAHNEIVYQDEVPKEYDYQYRERHSYGQMFGLLADGFYNTWDEVNDINRPVSGWNNDKIQPGDIRFKDINGDGKIDVNDQVPLGYSNFPETIFGFSFGGNFAGFDFSVLFQGATNVSLRYSKRTMQGWENEGGTARQIIENSWTYERYSQGVYSLYPRPSAMLSSHNLQTSSFNIADASYVRLKNAEIGYSLPPANLNRLGLNGTRFFVNANNLLTWTDVLPGEDPENPPTGDLETYPLTMTINVGLSVKF